MSAQLYALNNVVLPTIYNFWPGQSDGSNLAVSGCWDMPARLGKTSHDWGLQNGLEPYVLAEEIFFGGRDIALTGYIKGTDKIDAITKAYSLYSEIGTFTGLVPLYSPKFGTWNVYVSGGITTEYIGDGWLRLVIPFREPVVNIAGTIPTKVTDSDYGIDGIPFADIGITIISMQQQIDRAVPKPGAYTSYIKEGFRITKVSSRSIAIKAFIFKPNYTAFKNVITGLYALFSKPGTRTIIKPNDVARSFFVTNGFAVSEVNTVSNGIYGFVDFTITETSTNIGDALTDNFYNYILTGFGDQILTYKL